MTQTPDANSILMGGGGAPRAKFDTLGATFTGPIVAISAPYQEREYDQANPGAGAPKFYPKSGDPIMSFNVDITTTERDPSIDNDDGTRRIYMDGRRIKDAVRSACRQAAAPQGLAMGGVLSITYVSDETPGDSRSGKNYTVTYQAPANAALMGKPAPAAPGPAPAPAAPGPAPAPAAPAAVAQQLTPEQLAAFEAYRASTAAPA